MRPWTVRKCSAGATTLAPCGKGCGAGESPSAIVVPTSFGSVIELKVSRNAVASSSGLTRSSTRSATFCT